MRRLKGKKNAEKMNKQNFTVKIKRKSWQKKPEQGKVHEEKKKIIKKLRAYRA